MALPCDEPGKLMRETMRLLEEDGRDMLTLYKETGIPYHWLQQFRAGRSKGPSVNRVEFLRDQLLKQKG